ncbi:hypothetical protein VP1G_09028 [Cytospora mali]|uniref:Uncharacterized protein n=1 Tax=Cytospora mali TaxID=578113 RepID=A0A194VDC1_CYTMA|nr:hypothetical protein VP1G_09028 [Valsa mali var. pyri (nom. inval.)]
MATPLATALLGVFATETSPMAAEIGEGTPCAETVEEDDCARVKEAKKDTASNTNMQLGYNILLQNLRGNPSWNEENEALYGPDLTSALGQFFSLLVVGSHEGRKGSYYDLGRTQPSPTLELLSTELGNPVQKIGDWSWTQTKSEREKRVITTQALSQLTEASLTEVEASDQIVDLSPLDTKVFHCDSASDVLPEGLLHDWDWENIYFETLEAEGWDCD